MAWAKPEYTIQEINSAGKALAAAPLPVTDYSVLSVVNNWRSIHSYPLNAFQITLRRRARQLETGIVVAQRIKRIESIHAKLSRENTMRLSQMQDIGGCRVVFRSTRSVRELVERYKKGSKKGKLEHKFRGEKNYIDHPKKDGYRSHHLVYEYTGKDKAAVYSGQKIEIQIRTQLQHSWATAVEAVGIFTRQALKSNQGDADWIRFFALMSAVIAAIERCVPVPDTPTSSQTLVEEINELNAKLNAQGLLTSYNTTLNYTAKRIKEAKYFLVDLDPSIKKILVSRYRAKQSEAANDAYTKLESEIEKNSSRQVVLVSVDSIAALKKAYPNYFLDTRKFSEIVDQALRGDFPEPVQPTASPA